MRSKAYLLERTVGSSKCDSKKCQVCLNVSETNIFEFFQTKKQYKINHHLDFNDMCLIYLLSCKICGLHYVGSTTDRFQLRWIMTGKHRGMKSICSQNCLDIFIQRNIMGFISFRAFGNLSHCQE